MVKYIVICAQYDTVAQGTSHDDPQFTTVQVDPFFLPEYADFLGVCGDAYHFIVSPIQVLTDMKIHIRKIIVPRIRRKLFSSIIMGRWVGVNDA